MLDVTIRLGIAVAAGATMRMLVLLGVPWPLAMLGLVAAAAVVSWRLLAARIFIVLLVSGGYFVTYMLTMVPETTTADALEDNPAVWEIIRNAMLTFLPFALPPLGSMISLGIEKRLDKRAKEQEPITEESLLEEKIPTAKADDSDYDLRDIEESRL